LVGDQKEYTKTFGGWMLFDVTFCFWVKKRHIIDINIAQDSRGRMASWV
jgi:hypothetical protein